MMNKIKYTMSIVSGVIAVLGTTYASLAPIWNLPYAGQIDDTAKIVVTALSSLLMVFTIKKVTDNNNNGIPDELEQGEK